MAPAFENASLVGERSAMLWLPWLLRTAGDAPRRPGAEPAAGTATRSYDEGPLQRDDYQGDPPEDTKRLLAVTTTDIRYHFDYRFQFNRDRAMAYATGLRVDAVMIPEKSWIIRPNDARLTDHEQGHFDITYIRVLRLRVALAERAEKGQRFRATAATPQAARDLLDEQIREFVRPFIEAARARHRQYDSATNHGRLRTAQAEERRRQKEAIRKLTEQWRRVGPTNDWNDGGSPR